MPKNILVADSDVVSAERFLGIFSFMGYRVASAADGTEAAKLLQAEKPYMLIVEQDLPPEGGLKALEKLRELSKETKVILLTKDDPPIEVVAGAGGLDISLFVKKDFCTHVMLKKIFEHALEIYDKVPENKYSVLGKVLIVDDVPEIRMALASFLKIKGFGVQYAASGEQALAQIKAEKVQLVFLDKRMPDMDGLAVLKEIRGLDSTIKVVMMTAVEDDEIITESENLGACDYIFKPFRLESIEALALAILLQQKFA